MPSIVLEADVWASVVAMLELTDHPWPDALARADLAYLRAEAADGSRGRAPGRDLLARRWGWTPYSVRALLDRLASPTPIERQPKIDPITTGSVLPAISDQILASPTPARRQPDASPTDRQGRLEPASPARRQPDARRIATDASISARNSQPDASPTPDAPPMFPPHTPPSDLPLDHIDQKTDQEGGSRGEGVEARPQGRLFLLPTAEPAQLAASLPESQAFLQVWTRWRNAPNAPHRWPGGPAEALGWFLEQIGMPAETEIGRAIARLDVVGAIQAWDAWLSDRADEHGRPGTSGRSKFPTNWKSALRNWLINQAKFGRNLRPSAMARRGAWAGQATRLVPTGAAALAPADHGGTEPTCTPGDHDHDALERF
jgi:hypothetical protein